MTPLRFRFSLAALIVAALDLGAVALPSSAQGGKYVAVQCSAQLGAGHADAAFRATSKHYIAAAGCGSGAPGLQITHSARRTAAGRFGAWSFTAPAGTRLISFRAGVSGEKSSGHVPELLLGSGPNAHRIGDAVGGLHELSWTGADGGGIRARLRCARRRGCGPGRDAHLTMRRIAFKLVDDVPPKPSVAGSLLEPGSVRGNESLTLDASDVGGGIHRLLVEVNGQPVSARTLDCALSHRRGLRLRPCPSTSNGEFAVATGAAPFVQGPNSIRSCALDYAGDTSANQTCRTRTVRVDNECPLSGMPQGARLSAHFKGDGTSETIRRGEDTSVTGQVLDGEGKPVSGARVCVATRVPLDGQPERVIATPTTDRDGQFDARVPVGPSREVRVAYWRDSNRVAERMLDLRVRANPRFRLLPGGPLHNHDRVGFVTRLPRPLNGHRAVRVQVKAGGRWLLVRSGHTTPRGVWRSSYRFHSTTTRRTYHFRAMVPKQQGYPYEAGRSRIREQIVVG